VDIVVVFLLWPLHIANNRLFSGGYYFAKIEIFVSFDDGRLTTIVIQISPGSIEEVRRRPPTKRDSVLTQPEVWKRKRRRKI